MIHIREVQARDIAAMLALREQWISTQFPDANSTQRERAWFSRCAGNEMAPALVAVDGDRIVGYVLCALMTHPAMPGVSATIDEICVVESHRRRGIGRQLIGALRGQLRATVQDLSTIGARVDQEDVKARAFWSAMGFEQYLLEFTDYLEQ